MTKFLLDSHLGKLARWLRMLGYDAEIKRDPQEPLGAFVWQARESSRIPVTVRKQVPKDLEDDLIVLTHGSIVEQLQELKRLGLISIPKNIELAKSRCSLCNAPLRELSMEDDEDKKTILSHPDLKAGTLQFQNTFYLCENPSCAKLYWEGAHWHRIKQTLRQMM